jgi:predicted ArsR family transcriptional regulator
VPERREPAPFADAFTGLVVARAVTSAVVLGVFDALRDEPADASALAERLGLDPLGAETLLTTLLTLGYVEANEAVKTGRPYAMHEVRRKERSPWRVVLAGR